MENIHCCSNCRNYVKHYFWFKNRFYFTRKGQCRAEKKSKYLFDCNGSCDKWETDVGKEKIQTETLEQVLRDMASRINEIMSFIQENK